MSAYPDSALACTRSLLVIITKPSPRFAANIARQLPRCRAPPSNVTTNPKVTTSDRMCAVAANSGSRRDVRRFQNDYPRWYLRCDMRSILTEIIDGQKCRLK